MSFPQHLLAPLFVFVGTINAVQLRRRCVLHARVAQLLLALALSACCALPLLQCAALHVQPGSVMHALVWLCWCCHVGSMLCTQEAPAGDACGARA